VSSKTTIYGFLFVGLAVTLALIVAPAVYAVSLSFYQMDSFVGAPKWVGFANYVAMVDPAKGGVLQQKARALEQKYGRKTVLPQSRPMICLVLSKYGKRPCARPTTRVSATGSSGPPRPASATPEQPSAPSKGSDLAIQHRRAR